MIFVTSNDVTRTICLVDKDQQWGCYLRKVERERQRERLTATKYITAEIHGRIKAAFALVLFQKRLKNNIKSL